MLDPKVIEQKLKEALKNAPSVPIIYTSTFQGKRTYNVAEAYLWHGEVDIAIPGDEDEESLKDFLKYELVDGDIYFAIPGDKIG